MAALGVVITAGVATYRRRNPSSLVNAADDAAQVVRDFAQRSASVADDAVRAASDSVNKPIEVSNVNSEAVKFFTAVRYMVFKIS